MCSCVRVCAGGGEAQRSGSMLEASEVARETTGDRGRRLRQERTDGGRDGTGTHVCVRSDPLASGEDA